jgi:enediyne biosynthesis protein E4
LDEPNSRILENVGIVSGAVWSDLDNDGYAELILAGEWASLKIFQNDHGRLIPWNPSVVSTSDSRSSTLSQLAGWWNGVTTGDLDGDGRLDIIASNWGLNTPYQATPEHPATLYYGDLSGDGAVNLIEAEYDPTLKKIVPRRMREKVAEALPELLARFPTHKAYSQASIGEVLGDRRETIREVRANCLASMVFLNRSNHFEAQPLPAEAQFAPAFSVNVADFSGDGHEDVFLSQNFFANQPEVPRYDAGRGLLLRGDGTGKLEAVSGQESGIKIYGEQRGAAMADFDRDGRLDLAVTQNGAATKLFRNVSGKAGLRVRLKGPPGNPDGIGAQMRLFFGERPGPPREIHAGSGYWSQDSTVQVLATPQTPKHIWVRWPGGKTTTSVVPLDASEILVNQSGEVTVGQGRF